MWRLLAISAVVVVGVGCLWPVKMGPSNPYDLTDKFYHFIAFFGIAFLLRRAFGVTFNKAMAFTLLYGAGIELAQLASGYRTAEWGDLMADLLGGFAGASLYIIWTKVFDPQPVRRE